MTSFALLYLHSLRALRRERPVRIVVGLFVASVLGAVALGWAEAAGRGWIRTPLGDWLEPQETLARESPGRHMPGRALSLLHPLAPCLALAGAGAAMLIGHRCLEGDRRAGLLPLIGVRAEDELDYPLPKIAALASVLAGLAALSGICGLAMLFLLPLAPPDPTDCARLALFVVFGWAYLMTFGALAMAVTARSPHAARVLAGTGAVWFATTLLLPAMSGACPVLALRGLAPLFPASGAAETAPAIVAVLRGFAVGDAFAHLARNLLEEGAGCGGVPGMPRMIPLLIAPGLAIGAALRGGCASA